jgi:hypothetical protein
LQEKKIFGVEQVLDYYPHSHGAILESDPFYPRKMNRGKKKLRIFRLDLTLGGPSRSVKRKVAKKLVVRI